jgi:hypothetical protein
MPHGTNPAITNGSNLVEGIRVLTQILQKIRGAEGYNRVKEP